MRAWGAFDYRQAIETPVCAIAETVEKRMQDACDMRETKE